MKKHKINYSWIFKIVLLTFGISMLFSFISETTIPNINIFWSIILTLVFILIGVMFDMIGLAVTTANLSSFNSMAAKKVKGAKLALKFIKNADKVSSFCQDVIGDICGIVSGSTGAVISIKIANQLNCSSILTTLIIMSTISALTIGGKALGKTFAMNSGTTIVLYVGKIMSFINRLFGKKR